VQLDDLTFNEHACRLGPVGEIKDGNFHHIQYPPNGAVSLWIMSLFPHEYVGYAIDVGASDGISVNSTYVLEKAAKWTVLAIEPNPNFHPYLKQSRSFYALCAAGSKREQATLHVNLANIEAFSSINPSVNHPRFIQEGGKDWGKVEVEVRTLNDLLDQYDFPQLDALCIDTEGTEADVLAGIDLVKWRPKAIVVEAWDSGAHDELLASHGYEKRWHNADNDGYVRKD
jgi:FkbM family methyltransferase